MNDQDDKTNDDISFFFDFLKQGAESLVKENPEIVKLITESCNNI